MPGSPGVLWLCAAERTCHPASAHTCRDGSSFPPHTALTSRSSRPCSRCTLSNRAATCGSTGAGQRCAACIPRQRPQQAGRPDQHASPNCPGPTGLHMRLGLWPRLRVVCVVTGGCDASSAAPSDLLRCLIHGSGGAVERRRAALHCPSRHVYCGTRAAQGSCRASSCLGMGRARFRCQAGSCAHQRGLRTRAQESTLLTNRQPAPLLPPATMATFPSSGRADMAGFLKNQAL